MGVGSLLAGAGLLALTLVPLGQVFLFVGIVGGVLAAVVMAIGVKTADRGAVRLAAMTLLLALVGWIGFPFGIWFAVAGIWLWSRAVPEIAPSRGWLPAGTSSPVLRWLTAAVVLIAGFGLTIWSQIVSDPGQGTTGHLIDAARTVPAWAVALFVIVFVPVNAGPKRSPTGASPSRAPRPSYPQSQR